MDPKKSKLAIMLAIGKPGKHSSDSEGMDEESEEMESSDSKSMPDEFDAMSGPFFSALGVEPKDPTLAAKRLWELMCIHKSEY